MKLRHGGKGIVSFGLLPAKVVRKLSAKEFESSLHTHIHCNYDIVAKNNTFIL